MSILSIQASSIFTLVTICNYDTYQDVPVATVQPSVQRESNGSPTGVQVESTNKNDKEVKEGKELNTYIITAFSAQFDSFWKLYPRSEGKKAAWKAWQAAVKEVTPESILEAVGLFAESRKAKGAFCPHAATWLNQGRYLDDPAEWNRQQSGAQNGKRQLEIGAGQKYDPAATGPTLGKWG